MDAVDSDGQRWLMIPMDVSQLMVNGWFVIVDDGKMLIDDGL